MESCRDPASSFISVVMLVASSMSTLPPASAQASTPPGGAAPRRRRAQRSAPRRFPRSRHSGAFVVDSQNVTPRPPCFVAKNKVLSAPNATATRASSAGRLRPVAPASPRQGVGATGPTGPTGSARPSSRKGKSPPPMPPKLSLMLPLLDVSCERIRVQTFAPLGPTVSNTAPSGEPAMSCVLRPQVEVARRSPEGQDQSMSCCSAAACCSLSNSTIAATSSPCAAQHK
mmetsp:Transcript_30181/g.69668  ORF Transcript_30181/g.69668 Transcript_30181/m.69668 type:complete len:229 (-) Transcript_30181:443-1129(-)